MSPVMPVQKPGRSKQDYGTPDDFLAAVKRAYGFKDFDIDLAATRDFDSMEDNSVAKRCYTKTDNALVQPWKVGTGWNWLNPPFANIGRWVQRAYEQARDHNARTFVLVPAGVGSNWWRDWVHEKAVVQFLNGRLTFKGTPVNPKTGKIDPYPKDCALLIYEQFLLDHAYYDVWQWNKTA